MSMTKRTDGRYQISVTVDNDDGKRVRKVFYGKTQTEAKKKRDAFLRDRALGKSAAKAPNFDVWADKWLSIYGGLAGDSANASNDLYVRKLVEYFHSTPIDRITKSDIQRFASTFADGSFSQAAKIRSVTQRVFREAVADRLILFDPTLGVDWDYATKGTHRALERWETDLIDRNWNQHRFGILVLLMLHAGLRRGEVLALTWGDIKNDTIHVHRALHFVANMAVVEEQTKTEAGMRDIPVLSPVLRKAIETLRGADSESIAASCCTGGKVTSSAFTAGWKAFNAAMENVLNGREAVRQGQRNDLMKPHSVFAIRAHDLRHTFATMLYEAEVDMKTAQYLMGHADEKMIMEVYAHLRKNRMEDSIDRLRRLYDCNSDYTLGTAKAK